MRHFCRVPAPMSNRGDRHAPISVRLARRTKRVGECLLWTGGTASGYGRIQIGGKGSPSVSTHRVAWELANGKIIPPGVCVLHKCDVRRCVEPGHLFLGSHRDNIMDMWSKGRGARRTVRRSLTDMQVRHIRSTGWSNASFGRALGLDPSAISLIRSREIYSDVE